jgi:O-antigen ligase
MGELAALGLLLGAAALAFGIFLLLEAADRREAVVALVLGVVVVESLLFASQNDVPEGVFHPTLLGTSFRLPDLLVPAALLARLAVAGPPRRVTTPGLLWGAFIAWVVFGYVVGRSEGNDPAEVLFQLKALLVFGGAAALAAGVRPERVVARLPAAWWTGVLAVTALPLAVLTLSELNWDVHWPGLEIEAFGTYGADASSIAMTVALVTLVVESCRERPRPVLAAAALLLLLSPLAGTQSASVLQLATMGVLLVLVRLGVVWRRRTTVGAREGALFTLAMCAAGVVAVLVPAAKDARMPIAQNIQENFAEEASGPTAEARTQIWADARKLFVERPWLGWGLGKRIELREDIGQSREFSAHNVAIDMLLQSGVIGLGLFVIALLSTLGEAWWSWVGHADDRLAALSLACATAVVGLLAKGLAESVLYKFRLSTLLGLLVGTILAVAASRREPREAEPVGHRPAEDVPGELVAA